MNSEINQTCVVLSIAYDPMNKDYALSSVYKNGKDLLLVGRNKRLHEMILKLEKQMAPPNWISEYLAYHD